MGPKYIAKVKLRLPNSGISAPKSFKWEPYHMNMARYVRDNYGSFQKAQESKRKIGFLRGMRNALGIKPDECTDTQLKNGYTTFYNKYTGVKQKLNSSGFGVDPEKDSTLDKGWIIRACPYFEILDEVMGTRPNVTPPFIIATGAIAPASNVSSTGSTVENALENLDGGGRTESDNPGISSEDNSNVDGRLHSPSPDPNVDSLMDDDDDSDTAANNEEEETSPDPKTEYYVKKALHGINMKAGCVSAKTPMGMFAKVMEGKNSSFMEVEKEKLKQQQFQFNEEQKLKKERNEIELIKVNSQMAIETRKVTLEEEKLRDKKEERIHQIEILKLSQEFELKKLELQFKVPKN